jgi:hypothetical protein
MGTSNPNKNKTVSMESSASQAHALRWMGKSVKTEGGSSRHWRCILTGKVSVLRSCRSTRKQLSLEMGRSLRLPAKDRSTIRNALDVPHVPTYHHEVPGAEEYGNTTSS